MIETEHGAALRRNRRHLQAVPVVEPTVVGSETTPLKLAVQRPERIETPETVSPTRIGTSQKEADGSVKTRSGRTSRPASRLDL